MGTPARKVTEVSSCRDMGADADTQLSASCWCSGVTLQELVHAGVQYGHASGIHQPS